MRGEHTYDSKAGEAQVLEWARFAHSVQKGIKEKGNVGCEESRPGKILKIKRKILLNQCNHTHIKHIYWTIRRTVD